MKALVVCFRVAIAFIGPALLAQNPDLAEKNLEFTRGVADANHLIAHVSLEAEKGKFTRYQYDRYADVRRIIGADDIAYAQPKGKPWLKSSDWGKKGTAVKADKARELDSHAEVAEVPLAKPVSHDQSQGGTVWKALDRKTKGELEYYTYERSREHPRPDGFYPSYRFIKYKNDTDGKLLLDYFTGQLRAGERLIPVEIKLDYLIALPADTAIEIVPPKPPKK